MLVTGSDNVLAENMKAPEVPDGTAVIVPARLASQRFPRKLLHLIDDRPIILWTAERLRRELPGWPLFFAVAEPELAEVLEKAGFKTVMTDPELPSGTDRLAAANRAIRAKYVINVQADEPLVRGEEVGLLSELIQSGVEMATLATPIRSERDYGNPNRVKVVRDLTGRALYFSRAPIPHYRGAETDLSGSTLWHIGIYAYRAEFLDRYASLEPTPLEQAEKLEQLRGLEHGYRIAVGVVESGGIGIDAPEDVERFLVAVEEDRRRDP